MKSLSRSPVIVILFLLIGSVAAAQERSSIETVIGRQIEAFRRDAAAAAFSFASPNIQKRFRTPDVFLAMVARGYPQVYRPRSFQFAERVGRGETTLQKVIVVGSDGVAVAAIYEMIQVNGVWRINGCQIARLPGQDV